MVCPNCFVMAPNSALQYAVRTVPQDQILHASFSAHIACQNSMKLGGKRKTYACCKFVVVTVL